jgi:hypothetical protein
MMVVRQYFGDSFPSHNVHRDAVCQAVFFIGTPPVKCQTALKGFMRLGDHADFI